MSLPFELFSDALAELYAPLTEADSWTTGHLGQSLDGRIATLSGASCYVTADENLDHLHRMRALADAVIVGAGTVEHDNPRLTVRRVEGPNPLRVVLDPNGRLESSHGIFTDGQSETLLISGVPDHAVSTHCARTVFLPKETGVRHFYPGDVIALLRERGLKRLFIEGGGITVSRFLQADSLDRLHICIAPVIIGEGVRGIDLPGCEHMEQTLRPPARHYLMGKDVLFDLDLRS
ncbi:MAG: RibD family protein [Pseudomonadota bacterium]|uniref:RibD family protein n=1 Tax=Fodinicurvata fenggangensis TaxID=1121830 RepID=UPI0009DEAEBF|nr:RibD family protein [Fodinicurvata fenggangensis]